MPKIVDHEARRRDFIAAAYETLINEGLANTTVRAVSKKAGYTTGALLHYFGDKEELIRQVLQHFGSEMRQQMETARHASRGRQALRDVLLAALPTNPRTGSSWRVWLALWYHSEANDDMRREQRLRYREWIGRLTRIVEESITLGELPRGLNARNEARAMVGLIDGIGVQYLMSSGRFPGQRMIEIVENYIARLYAAPGTPGRRRTRT